MKKKKMIEYGVGAGVVTLLVIGYYVFANQPETYMVTAPVYGDIAGSVEESGNVKGESEKQYVAEVTASIADMSLNVGQTVRANEKLAEYNLEDLEKKYQEAQLNVKASESGYEARITESNKYASKYAKAAADDAAYAGLYAMQRGNTNDLKEDQYARAWNVQCAYDSIQKDIAEKTEESAQKTKELKKIADETSDKAMDIQDEISNLQIEIAKLQEDLATLPPTDFTPAEYTESLEKNSVLEDIARNWEIAKTDKASAEAQILNDKQKEQLKTGTELAKLQASMIAEDVGKAKEGVLAEFDGVVTKVFIKDDAYVTEGTPLFTVESTKDLKVTVMISKYDIGDIKVGQKAEMTVSGKTYPGTVQYINRLAESDATDKSKVQVEIHIDKPDDSIILGIETDVRIYTEEKKNVLLIPYEALYADDKGDYCYVIKNKIIEKKYITIGIVTDEYAEVIQGLDETTHVIMDAVTDSKIGEKANETLN